MPKINLNENQQALLAKMYDVVLDPDVNPETRKAFIDTKNKIEWGRNFDRELSDLMRQLEFLIVTPPVFEFAEEARKRKVFTPTIGGSTHGSW